MAVNPENIGVSTTTGDDGRKKYIITFSVDGEAADLDGSAFDPASSTSPTSAVSRSWARPLVATIAELITAGVSAIP